MPPELARLDTTVFDRTIRPLLQELPQEKIPNALNRKMYFVCKAAIEETPRANPLKILAELGRAVTLHRDDGSTNEAPVGYALAARRASKVWGARKEKLGSRKRKANLSREWQKLITKKLDALYGARLASSAFIKAGWAGAMAALAPFVKNKQGVTYSRGEVRMRGAMKGKAMPATAGWSPKVSVENTAQSKTDHRLGLIKHGTPGFQKGFDKEMANWIPYLEKEVLKESVETFNRAQH